MPSTHRLTLRVACAHAASTPHAPKLRPDRRFAPLRRTRLTQSNLNKYKAELLSMTYVPAE